MSSPSVVRRTDNSSRGAVPHTDVLVLSVHAGERGADEAERWARRVPGDRARAVRSSDTSLDEQLRGAQQVLVLDPGLIAARRGFGAKATSKERLQVIARLAGSPARVTWARTAADATRWVDAARA